MRARSLMGRLGALIWGGAIVGAVAVMVVRLLVSGRPVVANLAAAAPSLAVMLAAWTIVWLAWGLPRLDLTPAAMIVRNSFFTWRLPWQRIRGLTREWGLKVDALQGGQADGTGGRMRQVRVAATPTRSGFSVLLARQRAAVKLADYEADPLLLHLDAAQAAAVIADYQQSLDAEVELGRVRPGNEDVTRSLNVWPVSAAVGACALAVGLMFC